MAEMCYRSSKNRTTLHEVIPLETPFSIGILIGDICNFKCCYCVQSAKKDSLTDKQLIRSFLDMNTFKKIADQIIQFPQKIKLVMLSSMGEPTLNKDLPQMIETLSRLQIADGYEVVTNASVLTPELSRKLVDAGLTRLVISIQGITSQKYREICGYNMNIDELIDNIKYFYEYSRGKCKIHIKTLDIALESGEDTEFIKIFSSICDTIYIDHVVDCFQDVDFTEIADKNVNILGNAVLENSKECCSSIFHSLFIRPNGDVVTCCDPPYPITLGNVSQSTLLEIWNGEKRIDFLKMHLKFEISKNPICKECRLPKLNNIFIEDSITNYTEKLLKQIESKYGG